MDNTEYTFLITSHWTEYLYLFFTAFHNSLLERPNSSKLCLLINSCYRAVTISKDAIMLRAFILRLAENDWFFISRYDRSFEAGLL